ncbi:TPA: arsenite S-adenosylmethyltransferase [Candidatus Gastranaerophilales bacterium HUM_19]|nr:MAG TPA: arsenite S-adenosylmethyltransferase [Candidatus Gastranaerophilales bacterium HUM_17]DAB14325.1 MAG TPA: arsenite S-adenosylmethyltransferase [Candidatus Gastranaerophilales bacterium HUM_19]DAB25492.1 MAG TPA: arsenite S-adenosylmethyltransferase [Candidatus Gastranaerophilales bacterium HUM_23]
MDFDVKKEVQNYYGEIAKKKTCCSCQEISRAQRNYDGDYLENIPEDAIKASLGCANPLVFAELKEGETVLDLGSGGGIDVLMSSKFVGKTGKIYGLDMTDEMLELANKNKEKMGVENVEFIKGFIENIPLEDKTVDAIISNCVINLTEDKTKALSEAYRVLKDGGRLAIADVVSLRPVSPEIKKQAQLWAGCISGAIPIEDYKLILKNIGFKDISIEPVHIYTKAIIDGLDFDKTLISKENLEEMDGAFAGAHIKAYKN